MNVSNLDVQRLRKTKSDAEFRKILSSALDNEVDREFRGLVRNMLSKLDKASSLVTDNGFEEGYEQATSDYIELRQKVDQSLSDYTKREIQELPFK